MDKLTVLFVDDDVNLLSSMKRLLIYEPYEILLASSGEQALDILQQIPVDVMISDIKMPGISGIELIKIVSQEYPDLVKIFLSGQPNFDAQDTSSMVQALHRGDALKFINKSTTLCDELKEILQNIRQDKQAPAEMTQDPNSNTSC